MEIYIGKNNQQLGPFDIDSIKAKLSSGEISPNDLAWTEGESSWVALSELAEKNKIDLTPIPIFEQVSPPPITTSDRKPVSTEMEALPGSDGRIKTRLVKGKVVGAHLRTEMRTVVTGKRTPQFNPIGVVVKGIDKKESVSFDIQEFFIKPMDGGKQIQMAVEAQGFRVADGHVVSVVVVSAEDTEERAIAVLNHETEQRGLVLEDFSDLIKAKDNLFGFASLVIIIASGLIGLKFTSWIVFGMALVILFVIEEKFIGLYSASEKAKELLTNLYKHSEKCLDYALSQQM